MELLAGRVVTDGGVVPPEEYVVPEQAASEPAGLEPAEPAPAAPEHAFPERPSAVWTSQWEVGIVKLQVVPWVGGLWRGQTPNGEIWRGEAQQRCHISRHSHHRGSRSGHASRGDGHSIPWSLLHDLAPRRGGNQLGGSHALAPGPRVVAVVAKPYSGGHL